MSENCPGGQTGPPAIRETFFLTQNRLTQCGLMRYGLMQWGLASINPSAEVALFIVTRFVVTRFVVTRQIGSPVRSPPGDFPIETVRCDTAAGENLSGNRAVVTIRGGWCSNCDWICPTSDHVPASDNPAPGSTTAGSAASSAITGTGSGRWCGHARWPELQPLRFPQSGPSR